jgi:hypothetical protein
VGTIGYALILPGTRVDAFSKAVGEVLRDARQRCGLTLAAVGVRSAGRFKASVLGSYERGEKKISLERFSALADLYGSPCHDLLARVMTLLSSHPDRGVEIIDLAGAEQDARIRMEYGSPARAAWGSMMAGRSPPSAETEGPGR